MRHAFRRKYIILREAAKIGVRYVFGVFGLDVRRLSGLSVDTKVEALRLLKVAGLAPEVVIDVGVHLVGTPELYAAFPDAKFLLIEPAAEFAPRIQRICGTLKDAELIVAAAADRVGTGTLRITRDSYVHTGLEETLDAAKSDHLHREFVEVPVTTVDEVTRTRQLAGPYLLKVDVDGADLLVLKGAVETLKNTDAVIIEAPVDSLVERAVFLRDHGFLLWGIVDAMGFGKTLWQVDLVFINMKYRDDSRFRPWAAEGFRFS